MTPAATSERALRADAQRNLELILDAAAAVFAEQGNEACVAEIARRAGVGEATIFRRFETKDDLVAAVFELKISRLLECAQAAARKRSAWDGLTGFMVAATEMHLADRGFFQASAERLMGEPHLQARKAEVTAVVRDLVARAKAEGALRSDVSAEDITALCCAAAQAATMAGATGRRGWKHYLQVITDGMRAA